VSAVRSKLLGTALRLFIEQRNKNITVSDLAREANVARSTIYNLFPEMDKLFDEVAKQVSVQFNEKLIASIDGVDDPATRLAVSLALPLQEFHRDPMAGKFVVQFAFSESSLKKYWYGVPSQSLMEGVKSGRFKLSESEVNLVRGQMAGGLLSMMILIDDGHVGWRDAAAGFVFFQMRSLGLSEKDCKKVSRAAVSVSFVDAVSVSFVEQV